MSMCRAGASSARGLEISRRAALATGAAGTVAWRSWGVNAVQAAPLPSQPAYDQPGPCTVVTVPLRLQLPAEDAGLQVSATLTQPAAASVVSSSRPGAALAAEGGGPRQQLLPLVVFSPGFLVASTAYASSQQLLASWGFPVASYDDAMSALDPLPDAAGARLISSAADAALRQLAPAALTTAAARLAAQQRPVYLIGHSRGAKLSVLAAAADARVSALGLIDPVDATYDEVPGAQSCLPDLEQLAATRQLPVAIIGAGANGDCVPRRSNYAAFADALARGRQRAGSSGDGAGGLLAVVRQAGHLQFLDTLTTLQRSVCSAGKLDERQLAAATGGVLAAWGLAWAGAAPDGGGSDAAQSAAAAQQWLRQVQASGGVHGIPLDARWL